jgi:hypothetical protein
MKEVFKNLKFELPSLIFYFLFVLKRQIVILSLILLQNYALFQLHVYIIVSFFVFAYSATIQPHSDRSLNRQNTLNEAILLICSYHLLLFSDYIDDNATFFGRPYNFKSAFGWSMLAIIFVGVLLNVIIILHVTATKFKTWLMNRKVRTMKFRLLNFRNEQRGIER